MVAANYIVKHKKNLKLPVKDREYSFEGCEF
jgi:hypothetical protein